MKDVYYGVPLNLTDIRDHFTIFLQLCHRFIAVSGRRKALKHVSNLLFRIEVGGIKLNPTFFWESHNTVMIRLIYRPDLQSAIGVFKAYQTAGLSLDSIDKGSIHFIDLAHDRWHLLNIRRGMSLSYTQPEEPVHLMF